MISFFSHSIDVASIKVIIAMIPSFSHSLDTTNPKVIKGYTWLFI